MNSIVENNYGINGATTTISLQSSVANTYLNKSKNSSKNNNYPLVEETAAIALDNTATLNKLNQKKSVKNDSDH